ncbi:hypothetical protein A1D18_01810 [Candidatus Rickettsiella isopodorum]|jgi:hypothetical protein|uniref:Uncharacterized protein n=1 Tax=Candidatus Rickettsiella isopodorum TaxID=1225476 RepID=A0A1J8NN74_9COXI|nr:hypothetical protein [Candidatus Rickettsiella isopodorum]OIZ95462.1 hypothetical protein A1D18_01810 [Candidatus Rickettsiella isopodorum]
MKVKCITIYNEFTKEYVKESSWITIGKEYIILGIEIRKNEVSYLIASDSEQMPVLQNAIQFEIINGKIPSNWKIVPDELALFSILPSAWCEPGIMEAFYDHEPEALKIYRREATFIYQEEGML